MTEVDKYVPWYGTATMREAEREVERLTEQHRKMRLYTAGPMSHIRQFNYPAFEAIARALRGTGYEVISPAEMDSEELRAVCLASETGDPAEINHIETMGEILARDVKLIADEADGVVLMPGWEQSRGARLEAFIARHSGKPVFFWLGGTFPEKIGGRFPAQHDAVCSCHLVYDGGALLLELDDAELDHVLTAADTLTLMKMERDAQIEDMQASQSAASTISWMESETTQWVPIPTEKFASGANEGKYTTAAETRVVDTDTGGEKGSKLARFDLIPATPLRLIAEHYGRGAEKYEDRNWELGYVWSLSYAAMMRHINAWWDKEDIDPETGSHHLAAAAWHCLALLEWFETHPEKDDRP